MLDIEQLFTYHKPNDFQLEALQNVRQSAKEHAAVIMANCPPSPDRSVAIRKLRESTMDANASIMIPVEATIP